MNINNISVNNIDKLTIRKLHELTSTVYIIGSIIYSDVWKVFSSPKNNSDYTYTSSDRSKIFIDLLTGVHIHSCRHFFTRTAGMPRFITGFQRFCQNRW